ncbi:ABC transporter substrate-binding protein [Paramicrobacterium fandaimingii]|uniref:ABC transporter substrate-binding protein n=2 Tax=Paramicrobacterium fandaimingii TaxID=2708079 RepID=UPI001423D945|nr:ABC transporter substrate-binding protein [Microbacterium fandaimingii]
MKKALTAVALGAAAVLAFSGCTDSGASSATAPADDSSSDDMRTIRIAALPIAETGALWGAMDAGIFAEHNLEVEVVPAQGGALAIPALLSGDIEIAIGQPFGPFRADLQGLDVVMIGDYANSLPEGGDVNAVVSLGDSGIESPADLAGKRVAVNSLGAAGDLTIMKTVEDDGGDSSTIEFVEVAFPDAQAQLEAGNIDAAWVPDPFMSQIEGAGGNIVVFPYQATIPGLSLLTSITTQDLIDSDPELIADYSAAMTEALEWADANEDGVRAAIVENMGIPEEAAAGITLPKFTSELNIENLQKLADMAVEFGVLDAVPDFERLIQQQ